MKSNGCMLHNNIIWSFPGLPYVLYGAVAHSTQAYDSLSAAEATYRFEIEAFMMRFSL